MGLIWLAGASLAWLGLNERFGRRARRDLIWFHPQQPRGVSFRRSAERKRRRQASRSLTSSRNQTGCTTSRTARSAAVLSRTHSADAREGGTQGRIRTSQHTAIFSLSLMLN
jgi:hypothetical protein